MERNEFGHYIYTEEDIEMLKTFKEQIQNGVPTHSIHIQKKPRKASLMLQQTSVSNHTLIDRLQELERDLDNKANSVVTYQILQHRREIEELRTQVEQLHRKVEKLTSTTNKHEMSENPIGQPTEIKKRRKKNVFKSIFGQ